MTPPDPDEIMKKLLRLRVVVATVCDVLRDNGHHLGVIANVRVITPVREALEQSLKDSDPRIP